MNPVDLVLEGGSEENDNTRVREDYRLYETITNYFPPEDPPKSGLVPLVACGVLAVLFLRFFTGLYSQGANLGDLSFWGVLFLASYLGVYAVIVAFWVKVNLIITLWTLVALVLPVLFLMNKGLTADNCHISDFKLATKLK